MCQECLIPSPQAGPGRLRGQEVAPLGAKEDQPYSEHQETESHGADIAAQNTYHEAGDQWASREYRREVAGILTRRSIAELGGGK